MSEKYPSAGYAWYAVGVLYVAYVLSFVDRQIIAFLVGPIRADLGITDFQFSLIHGLAFVVFYAVLGIPIGLLADRRNRRNLIALGIGLWSLMTALCGFAASYVQLFLARIGVGVGEATLSPSAVSMIADSFPRARRGLPINIYSAGVHGGIGLANIFGGVIVGYTAAASGLDLPLIGHLRPWQAAFVLVALPGILVVLLTLTLREPVRQEQTRVGGVGFAETLGYLRGHWLVYGALILGAAASSIGSYGMYSWVPALLERRFAWDSARIGISFGTVTLIFGTAGLAMSGALAGAMLRAGGRAVYSKLMVAAMSVAIVPALLLVAVPEARWTLGCVTLLVFLLAMPVGLVQAALQAITPNEMRAQVIAIYLAAVAFLGLGTGPSAVAALTDFYFADDAMVGRSISIVAVAAAALSVVLLALGIPAYARRAAEFEAHRAMSKGGPSERVAERTGAQSIGGVEVGAGTRR